MPTIDFYEVKGKHWQKALCELAEGVVAEGARVYLWASSEAHARQLDDLLWTFRDGSFVPHNLWQGREASDEPLTVGWAPGNPNGATCLFLARDGAADEIVGFERIVDFAPVDDPALRDKARSRFRAFRGAGRSVTFHPAAP